MKRAIERTYFLTPAEVRDAVTIWLKAKDVPQPPMGEGTRMWIEPGCTVDDGCEINVMILRWYETIEEPEPKK